MHMANGESLFGIHGAALTLRSQRLNLLASNIANAATPGYRARDIDFDRALSLASRGYGADRAANERVEKNALANQQVCSTARNASRLFCMAISDEMGSERR